MKKLLPYMSYALLASELALASDFELEPFSSSTSSEILHEDIEEVAALVKGYNLTELIRKLKDIKDPDDRIKVVRYVNQALYERALESKARGETAEFYRHKKMIAEIIESLIYTHENENDIFELIELSFNALPAPIVKLGMLELLLDRFKNRFYWKNPANNNSYYIENNVGGVLGLSVKHLNSCNWAGFLDLFLTCSSSQYNMKYKVQPLSKKCRDEKGKFWKIFKGWVEKGAYWEQMVTDSQRHTGLHSSNVAELKDLYKVLLKHKLIKKPTSDQKQHRHARTKEEFYKEFLTAQPSVK
jgi:hypothetical protein